MIRWSSPMSNTSCSSELPMTASRCRISPECPARLLRAIGTKAKVVNGKVQFQTLAIRRLHQYDGMDLDKFLAIVRERIAVFSEYKMMRQQ